MLEPEEYISRFLPVIQVKYPNLTYEQLNLIVRAPFIFLRRQMALPSLPWVRFKYWGVYYVKSGIIEGKKRSKARQEESTEQILKMKDDE